MSFDAALQLVQLKRPAEALEKLGESFDPEDPWDWWLRGLALYGLDRNAEAIEAAEQGLALDPESITLLALLARCRLDEGDLPRAEEAVLAALRLDAEDVDHLALYAHIVATAGQFDKARKLIERARQIDPENTAALRMQSTLAVARGDEREALLRSRELLTINPEDVHAHRIAGAVLHDRGNVDDAAEHLRSAVVIDPQQHDVAGLARENLLWRNPFMWPLRPLQRFGLAPIWIGAVAVMFAARMFASNTVKLVIALVWLTYCVYSWVVPPLVRRWLRRS
jgi:tetratricopeptide (TPR) repeat protein